MKFAQSFVAAVALVVTAASAHAAEVTVATSPMPMPFPMVQKYAQVCLENGTDRSLVVGASWYDWSGNASILPSGGQHVYRVELTGTIQADETAPLEVSFRNRGLFTQTSRVTLDVPFDYSETDDCDEMDKYRFVYVSTFQGARPALVPAN